MNKHILIIDDNQDLLMMMTALLKNKGYAVSVSDNAENIIDVIKKTTPDIIMMDMLLAGADGRQICTQIKADAEIGHIPLIMLSAYPQAAADCLNAGANGFIEKPFDMKYLLDTLEKV